MSKSSQWITNSLMGCPIWYCLVIDKAGLAKAAKRIGMSAAEIDSRPNPASLATTFHLDHEESGHTACIVYLRTDSPNFGEPTGVEIVGILAHEGVHVWQAIREAIGEHEPSTEFEAYSVQSIVESLCQSYADQVAKKGT